MAKIAKITNLTEFYSQKGKRARRASKYGKMPQIGQSNKKRQELLRGKKGAKNTRASMVFPNTNGYLNWNTFLSSNFVMRQIFAKMKSSVSSVAKVRYTGKLFQSTPFITDTSIDLELVSSLARVRNTGKLFQSNICNLFLPRIQLLSVLLGCPLQRGVCKARVDCITDSNSKTVVSAIKGAS